MSRAVSAKEIEQVEAAITKLNERVGRLADRATGSDIATQLHHCSHGLVQASGSAQQAYHVASEKGRS